MIRAALLFLLVVVGASGANFDAARQADALRLREGYRGRPGALREEGPYQIREVTWRQHMGSMPFAMARQEGPARACALKHIRWLAGQLEARDLEVSPRAVAVAWNAGLARYLSGRAPERAWHFAADVAALYEAAAIRGPSTPPTLTFRPSLAH